MVKVAFVCPAATVTVAGKSAACEFEQLIATAAPPVGAGPSRPSAPVTDWPCEVAVGLIVKLVRFGG